MLAAVANQGASTARKKAFLPKILLAGGVLTLAALAAYHNSFSVPLIFDDLSAVTENPAIRKLWPIRDTLSPPPESGVCGRPLVSLSLAVNHALGGTEVRGYHAFNLGIHVLAGLTLLGVMRRTLRLCPGMARLQPAWRLRLGAASLPLASATALLWTLHPLQTEAVTYVSQRTEILMGLFYLLTLYCFIRGAEEGARPGRRFDGPFDRLGLRAESSGLKAPSRFDRLKTPSEPRGQSKGWHTLAVAACWLGMATKEVMVTCPVMVLLYDRTFVAGTFREAWKRHRGLYLGLAGAWVMLGFLMAGLHHRGVGYGLGIPWWVYTLTECRGIVHYLGLTVWPHPLIFDYGGMDLGMVKQVAGVAPSVLILFLLVAGVLIGLWRRPILGFVGSWFFVILAPTSSVVPVTGQPVAEHRLYLPLAAVVAAGVAGSYAMAGRRSVVVSLVLAAGLGVLTSRRNKDYRSELTIWNDTVAKCPKNPRAHNNLGNALVQAGRAAEAIRPCAEALRLKPDYAEARCNLGNALLRTGRTAEAMEQYTEALRLKPDYPEAHCNLGAALFQTGRIGEAIGHYEEALRLKPHGANARYNLAFALERAGRVEEAIRQYAEVLLLNPGDAEARNGLARLQALPQASAPAS